MKKILIALILTLAASVAFAGVPNLMTYQGKLTGTDGQPVADGTYSLTYGIYADSTSGTALWTETGSANTDKGIFNARLGSTNPLPSSLFGSPNLFLGISVNGGSEMALRHRLTSVAFAFHAANADTAKYALMAPTASDGDWAIADSNIYRMDGNIGIGMANPTEKMEIEPHSALRLTYLCPGAGTDTTYRYIRLGNLSDYWGGLMQTLATQVMVMEMTL
jgi:hypothetical protein